METVPVISLGAAAFWIALAAVLIAGGYHKLRREQMKTDMLLRLIEKTGKLDEEQVKALFPPAVPPVFVHQPAPPNNSRRDTVIGGVIVLSVGAGIAGLATILAIFGTSSMQAFAPAWFGIAILVACLGIGILVASLYLPRAEPAKRDDRETQ